MFVKAVSIVREAFVQNLDWFDQLAHAMQLSCEKSLSPGAKPIARDETSEMGDK